MKLGIFLYCFFFSKIIGWQLTDMFTKNLPFYTVYFAIFHYGWMPVGTVELLLYFERNVVKLNLWRVLLIKEIPALSFVIYNQGHNFFSYNWPHLYLKPFKNTFFNFCHKNSNPLISFPNIFPSSFKLQCSEISQSMGHKWPEGSPKGRENAPKARTQSRFVPGLFLFIKARWQGKRYKGSWLPAHSNPHRPGASIYKWH